ncbi:MAG: glycosyltransferase [Gammaproteobacteria bacterium]
MKLTIAICTWNREALLGQALASIHQASAPQNSDWEIIVVNNNCTDGTDAVVHQFIERLPIRLVHEPKPGLSNARNAAIDNALGDYIIWTDDDVIVGKGWIVEYERAFTRWPEAGIFGGSIIPRFEAESPAWLPSALPYVDAAFATRDVNSSMVSMTPTELPYGANFAVRTQEQRHFRYNTELGTRPGKLIITDEETVVMRAILAEGGSGRWVPSAAVDHWIPRARQTITYLRAYYKGQGWMHGKNLKGDHPKATSNRFWMLWLGAAIRELRYRIYRVTRGPGKWVPAMKSAAFAWGKVAAGK